MQKTNKISTVGKFLIILASVIMMIFVSGKWLNLYQIPLIFGNSVQHEYSLFEISDFIETFDMYMDNDGGIGVFVGVLTVGAVIVMIMGAISIILTLLNKPTSKITTIVSVIVSVILVSVFIGAINIINSEVEEATYGGIEKLLKTTANPYWTVIMAIISCVGARLKGKENSLIESFDTQGQIVYNCPKCGSQIDINQTFCNNCGSKIDKESFVKKEQFCTACGAKVQSTSAFCESCGAKIE